MSETGSRAIYREVHNWRNSYGTSSIVFGLAVLIWLGLLLALVGGTGPELAQYLPLFLFLFFFLGIVFPVFYARWEYRVEFFRDRLVINYEPLTGETVRLSAVTRVERVNGDEVARSGRDPDTTATRVYRLWGRDYVGLSLRDGARVFFQVRDPDSLVAAIRAVLPLYSGR